MTLTSDLHEAHAKLGEARTALLSAATEVPIPTAEPGKTQAYELVLMADEARDISDRLLLMTQVLEVPLPPES